MSDTYLEYIHTILEYRRSIAFAIGLIGVTIIDLTIASSLPFWLNPLILGIIGGIIIGAANAGLFTGLGTLVGRFVSILIMILTMPGLIETLDYFLAAIGDVLGAPLPPGSLIIILLSSVICGLFGLLGGLVGGSATKITKFLLEEEA
ncbi:MAG: hypothetical protein ACXACA_08675 [Candidatus Ranarchaeia archaeon]|jgi:hypothetical protein